MVYEKSTSEKKIFCSFLNPPSFLLISGHYKQSWLSRDSTVMCNQVFLLHKGGFISTNLTVDWTHS